MGCNWYRQHFTQHSSCGARRLSSGCLDGLQFTTTKRTLPVFESNEPFPCPTLPTKWDCLESNQHLCLARQCSHRCALKKAGGYRKYTGKHRAARTGKYLLLLWPAFNHIRRGGILVFSHNQEGCLWALLITRKLRYPHALSAALRRRRKSLGSSRTKVSLVDVELLSMSTAASLLPKSGWLRTS